MGVRAVDGLRFVAVSQHDRLAAPLLAELAVDTPAGTAAPNSAS